MARSPVNFILTVLSITIWFLSVVGNVKLLQYSKGKWKRKKTINNNIFFVLAVCNVLSCVSAIPFHIAKLILDNYETIRAESIACLIRYLATMVTTDMSLIMLTALIVDRRDRIVLEPYGLAPRINARNKKKVSLSLLLFVLISNSVIFGGLLGHLVLLDISPCDKSFHKDTATKALTYLETVKTCLIAIPCLALMVRSLSSLQKKIQQVDDGSVRMRNTVEKINQTYYYCASFLAAWLPFGVMAILAEEVVSAQFYNTWFNVGYTISYGYILAIPVVTKITDNNFVLYDRRSKSRESSYGGRSTTATESISIATIGRSHYLHIAMV